MFKRGANVLVRSADVTAIAESRPTVEGYREGYGEKREGHHEGHKEGYKEELHLELLRHLEKNSFESQRQLARRFDVSLGKLNYCLNALIEKGFVKMDNFQRNPNKMQYVYMLTPAGIQEKFKLTKHFLSRKMREYDELAREIERLQLESQAPNVSNINESF